jgi:toxin CptA
VQLPITIGLHRSRFIDVFVAGSAGLASLFVLLFPCAVLIRWGLLLTIWSIALVARRQCSLKFSAIRLERDGQLSVILATDQEFTVAELLPGATVHPWLTVLRLKTGEGCVFPLLLSGDSLSADDFRRLRVFLRWRADFSGRADDA